MAGSYYNVKKGMNQMKSVTNNLMAGINLLKKSDTISDDQLSDSWGAHLDETTGGLLLSSQGNSTYTGLNGSGEIVSGISAMDMSAQEYVFLLTKDVSDATGDDYLDNLVKIDVSSSSPVEIDISSYNLSYDYVSMCLFSTEAKRFVCFVASDVKKLFYHDFSALKTCDIPFYPKKIVSHYNRIFAIDTSNKLWWSRAGDLTSWYGLDKDDDYIVAASTDMKNGTYTLLANPDVPRPIMVTVTKTSTIDTLGILTVVGTNVLDEALTEVITPVDGIAYGLSCFKTITSITGSGWSAVAGADKIKVGIAPVTGFTQTDSGVWTLEQEYSLVDMTVLGDALYIWSTFNIYVFQGYSYDTFSLRKIIANLGCVAGTNITCCGNIAYFWGTQTELYEYNGNDYPNIINKPVYVNGAIANGINGSIPDTIDSPVLVAIAGKLYLYSKIYREEVLGEAPDEVYYFYFTYYEFDTRSRSWWKQPGLLSLYNTDYGSVNAGQFYIPNVALSDTYNYLWFKDTAADAEWAMYYYPYDIYYTAPYVVTKAFNSGITEDQTLTTLILYVRYDTIEVGGIMVNVYYSKTTDNPDDWTLLYAYEDLDMETLGEPTIITINLVGSEIARTRHFRLKITANADVHLCGLERRYRVIGRSR